MNPTRKMWISAGVVGVVLAGGISVAAAAASGRGDKTGEVSQETAVTKTYGPGEAPGQIPGPEVSANAEPTRAPKDFVVTNDDINPDPKKVAEFWTEKRMENAEPLPIPVITGEKKPKK
ncbi:hypothetical protein [Sphaerisporangium corydalis]|uniref:Uncharacterized protein n=1 Tax=Sphaerisporangium corydalis TaxID=1441875 RepID=A0ABV9EE92_9ACTN|nr:hypothetical protein [Sphaerisporangium corydalis]